VLKTAVEATDAEAATTPPRRYRSIRGSLETREGRLGLLFVAPVLVYLIALGVYPLLYAGWKSLYQINIFHPSASTYYGLGNYRDLWHDEFFAKSITLTIIWAVSVVAIEVVLGITLALLLDRKMTGVGLLRTLIVLPVFVSPIGMGLTWRFIMDPVTGLLNWLLHDLGLSGSLWLSSPHSALPAVMIADVWQWTPFVAIIVLAAIQSISPEIVEAARLDDVKGLRYLRRILLPLIWPVLVIVILLRLVDSIRIFDLVWIMTGGGPGSATLLAGVNDYSIFQSGNFGETAALGFVILLMVDILVVAFLRVLAGQNKRLRQPREA
jgi:multiple sugar transport system permease protein